MVQKSNRVSKGRSKAVSPRPSRSKSPRGSKVAPMAAHKREVFILTPEVAKPRAEVARAKPQSEAARQSREERTDGHGTRAKLSWGMWLRRHWGAVAIGGAVITGALTTWMVCRRREQLHPLDRVRRFLNVD